MALEFSQFLLHFSEHCVIFHRTLGFEDPTPASLQTKLPFHFLLMLHYTAA